VADRQIVLAYPSGIYPEFAPPINAIVVDSERWKHVPVRVGPDPEKDPVGARDHLQAVAEDCLSHADDVRLVPLTEEAVLPCGAAASQLRLKGFNLGHAMLCSDRFLQRNTLPGNLNPDWKRNAEDLGPFRDVIYKAPAFTMSEGVSLEGVEGFQHTPSRVRMRDLGFAGEPYWICEELLTGPQWEVTGITRDKVVRTFRPLVQTWDRPAGSVTRYRYGPAEDAFDAIAVALQAVRALGLTWCAWNVELMKSPSQGWKVIEVHARPGEDTKHKYPALAAEGVNMDRCVAEELCSA